MTESNVAADRLRLKIERIERLEEEKKGIADDISDVYAESKAEGYDVKIMRQIVRLRKMQPHDRREMQAILETYQAALGMDGRSSERPPEMFEGHDGRPEPSTPDAALHTVAPQPGAPALVCAGIGPILTLSVPQIDFPPTPVGQTSAPIAVTVTNVGTEKASVSSIVASDDFSASSDCGGALEPGESFTLRVTFTPGAPGTIGGYVAIDGDSSVALVMLAQAL